MSNTVNNHINTTITTNIPNQTTNPNSSSNPLKVITGPDTRWSYANVWEPKSINGDAPKYSVSLIIPKSDTLTLAKIEAAIAEAYRKGEAKLRGRDKTLPPLASLNIPLRDGDAERPNDPAYADAYFLNASSYTAPGIIDADYQDISDRSQVYSGVYGRASINFYAYNHSRDGSINRGIGCRLNHLQKFRDGEPLGAKTRAEEDFAPESNEAYEDFLA